MIKKLLENDVVERAVKTFIQTFLATVAVGVVAVDSVEGAWAIVTGAVAAAISAAWNSVKAKRAN